MADLSQFAEATAAVKHSPHAVSAWEEAEGLAADLDKPDDIVGLFNETLAATLEPEVAEMIGERAGAFCDEWCGDEPKVLEKILSRVLVLAPASESALQRLSVIYTVAARWADVLALYDRSIGAAKDKSARVRLLREAAQLAKDVANQPEKAIAYYQQRPREVSRVLEKTLEIDPAHSRDLREEAGQRLAELDDVPAAMDHYAALLALAPESQVTEEKLRTLAERGGAHDRYGAGLANAARTAPNIDPTRKVALLAASAPCRPRPRRARPPAAASRARQGDRCVEARRRRSQG